MWRWELYPKSDPFRAKLCHRGPRRLIQPHNNEGNLSYQPANAHFFSLFRVVILDAPHYAYFLEFL